MRAFVFPLRQALAWRRTQLETEQNRLRRLAGAAEALAVEAVRLDLAKERSEQTVRGSAQVEAADLWALAAYRARILRELQALAERRKACAREVEQQRQKVLEAQRQCRLIEKLEQRRRAEWQQDADRETENLAAESFLAAWNRRG